MKWMIASDLHGSALTCRQLWENYEKEGAERMLLLGDLLYHGPRNDLPEEYGPKQVIEMLNDHREECICVRGNCDTEVDQMVLEFSIMAPFALLSWENRLILATHGHRNGPLDLPSLKTGEILLHGHTHVPTWEEREGILVLNPGSVTIPKEGSCRSYMIFEDGVFSWKRLEDRSCYHSLSL